MSGRRGTHGDQNAGDPLQYDELRIEHEGDAEAVVYNRAILVRTDSEAVRRIHQLCWRPSMTWRRSRSVAFRCVAHGFDVVPIGVDDERPIVVRVILRAQSRLAIASAAGGKRCTVELPHRLTRRRSKRDVKARRWTHAPLRSRVLETDVEGKAFHRVVLTWRAVRHLARNLKMGNKPERRARRRRTPWSGPGR